ncbi:MAG: radical SAM protein [Elusimicrobia bacterium]|nr:radical SAM protein [Elusimicrobiota bacterium]
MRLSQCLSFLDSAFKACILGRRIPLSVSVELTDRCNFKCRYCDQTKDGMPEMTTAQVFSLMDDFYGLGTRRIGLTGGEPLLRDDIEDIIAYGKAKGLIVNLATNGYLLAGMAPRLKGLDLVIVSLDGSEGVHDSMRMPGSFRRAVEGIAAMRKLGKPVITSTVLTRLNLQDIGFILELARATGFSSLFTLLFHHPRSISRADFEKMVPGEEDCRKAFQSLIERKKGGYPVLSSWTFLRYMASGDFQKRPFDCKAGDLYCAVDCRGNIGACGLQLGDAALPNGVELGFRAAFDKLRRNPCARHYCNFGVEESMILSLNPEAVANFMRHLVLRRDGR